MRFGFWISLGMLATTAAAQGVRDSDELLSAEGLQGRLSGQVLEFFDGSQAFYGMDGAYQYRYRPEDPPFVGTFRTAEGGEVCVTFDNGFDRCDTFVLSGGRMVLIIEDGTRFPVRETRKWDGS